MNNRPPKLRGKDVRTVSFHVFFDELSRTKETPILGIEHTIRITITGNKYQIQGFMCHFFAQCGPAGMDTDEMMNYELAQYLDQHFEDDPIPQGIVELSERYVINISESAYGENELVFLTCHLEDFVSGMEAVPSQILISTPSQPDVAILPQYSTPEWKSSRYLDLDNPEQKALYLNGDVDDSFEDAPDLRMIETRDVHPMSVTMVRASYRVSRITLEEYLHTCYLGKPFSGTAGALSVSHWALPVGWLPIHTLALAHVCNRLKISKLVFAPPPSRAYDVTAHEHVFRELAKLVSSEHFPFLPDLRKIEMDYTGIPVPFCPFMETSRVDTLTCNVSKIPVVLAIELLLQPFHEILSNNFQLKNIRIGPANSDEAALRNLNGSPLNDTKRAYEVSEMLTRNKRAFQNCLDATVILLWLAKTRRQIPVNWRLMPLIIQTVWSSRCTSGWAK